MLLIESGVWGKWGENGIISSWETVTFYEGIPWEMSTIRDTEKPILVLETSAAENLKKKMFELYDWEEV